MKTEFKGTKGNWQLASVEKTFVYALNEKGTNAFSLSINNDGKTELIEQQANAKLISCAPEMLEIIKLMVNEFEYENCTQYEFELIYKARKLIEKATTI